MGLRKAKVLKRVTVTVDPDDFAAVEIIAQKSEVSASWLIRKSMREFLERRSASEDIISPVDR